jgi:hypothetical protein
MGASVVKWTKQVLQCTKTMDFLVKGLKVGATRYLNWKFIFIIILIVVLNTQMYNIKLRPLIVSIKSDDEKEND